MANKNELVSFLDRRVFDPILRASPDQYGAADRQKLQDVQESTRSEKERFRHYRSADDVKNNYLSDLNSSTAKRINKELEDLGLPRLPDVKDEFLKLAGQ